MILREHRIFQEIVFQVNYLSLGGSSCRNQEKTAMIPFDARYSLDSKPDDSKSEESLSSSVIGNYLYQLELLWAFD